MTVRLVLRPFAPAFPRMAAVRWLFLAGGLLAVGCAGYDSAQRYFWQADESRWFDHSIALRQAGLPAIAETVSGHAPIGRIEIPRLNLSAMVKEGADDRTLAVAAGHIPGTALPGQQGNVGIAAHRDSLFRNLKDIRRDDTISVTTLDHHYLYRVVSLRIVQPDNVSVLQSSPEGNVLTLVTCYPFYYVGDAPKRFIVHAIQVL